MRGLMRERLRKASNLLAAAIDRGQGRIDNEIGGNVLAVGLDDSRFGLRLLALPADAIGNRQFVMAGHVGRVDLDSAQERATIALS